MTQNPITCSSQSSDKTDKLRKPKRGTSLSSQPVPPPPLTTTTISTTLSNSVVSTTKRGSRNNHQTPPPSISVAPVTSIIQGPSQGVGHFSSVGTGSGMGPTVKDSPPSSPGSESMSNSGPVRRKRKSAGAPSITPTPSTSCSIPTAIANSTKDEKDVKL